MNTRYFYNPSQDMLYKIDPVSVSKVGKNYFCSTTVNIFYKENPINPETHQREKITSHQLTETYPDNEEKSKGFFNTEILRYIRTSNEITEDEFKIKVKNYQ